eukprot:snap_masked-scaffold_4-processed-gene-5.25-mRNA-1 protein AED:1.00 eAED:1.00 QI:0/0/0/0/1/1/2/0/333
MNIVKRGYEYLMTDDCVPKSTNTWKISLLGASTISKHAVLKPAKYLPNFHIASISSRSLSKAKAFAKENGVENYCVDYFQGINNCDIVYISLRTSDHMKYIVEAVNKRKIVFCEKPLTLDPEESKKLIEMSLTKNIKVYEAYHYRFHPAFKEFQRLFQQQKTKLNKIVIEAIEKYDIEKMYNLFCYCIDIFFVLLLDKNERWNGDFSQVEIFKHEMRAKFRFKDIQVVLLSSRVQPSLPKNNIHCYFEGSTLEMINFATPFIYHEVRLNQESFAFYNEDRVKSTYEYQLETLGKLVEKPNSEDFPGPENSFRNSIFFTEFLRKAGKLTLLDKE